MDTNDLAGNVRAHLAVPDADIYVSKDAASMAHVVSAELDSRIAAQVAERALNLLSSRSNMSANGLIQLLQFLSEDHETQMRYTAWRTARRLRGDK
jgi:hypothetical protein